MGDGGAGSVHPPRHVLVIGLGFIGSRIGGVWRERGCEVSAITRSDGGRPGEARRQGTSVTIGNAADPVLLEAALAGVDHVVYSAGGLLPAESNAAPVRDAVQSLEPLVAVLEALRTRPEIGLTYLSSGGTVYGDPRRLPVREDDPTEPVSSYGIVKLACENFITLYVTLHGLRARILRCSNVYGGGQPVDRLQGAVGVFLDRMERGLPLPIWGDGLQVRDYVHVDDVADAVIELAALPGGPGVVNVGSGQGHTLLELIKILEAVTGIEPLLEFSATRGFDVRSNVLDVGLLRSLIDVAPIRLEDGVARTWRAMCDRGRRSD